MKPYGYKKMRKVPGDGCHLCMKGLSCSSKRSKSANRSRAKQAAKEAGYVIIAKESVPSFSRRMIEKLMKDDE